MAKAVMKFDQAAFLSQHSLDRLSETLFVSEMGARGYSLET